MPYIIVDVNPRTGQASGYAVNNPIEGWIFTVVRSSATRFATQEEALQAIRAHYTGVRPVFTFKVDDEPDKEEVETMLDLGPVRGVCSWCGLELYGDSDPQARMRQHQRECQEHPMAALLTACKEVLRICRIVRPSEQAVALDRAEQMLALAIEKVEEKTEGKGEGR